MGAIGNAAPGVDDIAAPMADDKAAPEIGDNDVPDGGREHAAPEASTAKHPRVDCDASMKKTEKVMSVLCRP